jgi:hypothetical protein
MTGVKSTDLTPATVRRAKVRGAPDRRGGVFRVRALDGSSAIRFGRRIRGGPEADKSPQVVFPALISNLGVLYIPSANTQFVYPNLIDQQPVQFRPNIPPKVTPALIANLGVLYNAQVPTAQTVTAALIANLGVLYIPTVNSKTVSPSLIDQTGVLFRPNIPPKVTPALIANLGVLYAFGIGVAPELIDQSGVLYDVAITSATIDVSPSLIDQSGVLYNAAASVAQPRTVNAGFIDQTGVLFIASVRQKTKPLIVKVGVYDPTIEKVGRYVPTIVKRGVFVS